MLVQPGAKVDSSYYCDVVLNQGVTTRHAEAVW